MALELSLPPEWERYLAGKVASGEYGSPSEAIVRALRLMQELDAVDCVRLERLRQAVQVGLQEADRGELADGDDVFRRLEAKIDKDLSSSADHAPLHATR